MATSARLRKLNQDYEERIYAGLLGQAIGAGLGHHHLGDVRTLSGHELGKIGYDLTLRGDFSSTFVNDALNTGLSTARVLDDFGYSSSFGADHVARTWLNYAIENHAMLWWGGYGNSAPHSAFQRLKKNVQAAHAGVLESCGSPLAEQSGAEACALVWGMICPCDPERAAEMAAKVARVSYDGAAVHAAQAAAACVSAAFVPAASIDDVLSAGEMCVPKGCAIARLIADLREWHGSGEAWQHIRERVLERYAGSAYDERHAVPHFAGVVMALLAGNGELPKSLALAAAAGWGTAANLSIIAGILGVKNGLLGVELCTAWHAAIGDIIFLPSADSGRCVSDVATEALALARMGRELQRVPVSAPKKGARFHFELPGSTQGFVAEMSSDSPGLAMVRNLAGHSRAGKRALALIYSSVAVNRSARVAVSVFPKREKRGGLLANYIPGSPTLYPGQTIRAYVEASVENRDQAGVRPFIRYFGANDEPCILRGPEKMLLPDSRHEFQWTLPHATDLVNPDGTHVMRAGSSKEIHHAAMLGRPIVEMGIEIFSDKPVEGVIYLDYVTWDGAPRVELGPPEGSGVAWQHAWVNAATQCEFGKGHSALRICQNEGTGLLIQGARNWRDYSALANVTPRMARAAGIAICVQGLTRYYALLLSPGNKVQLIKQREDRTILAEAGFAWAFGQTVELSLSIEGKRLTARANGRDLFTVEDTSHPLDGGAFALVVEAGCVESAAVRIAPVE